MPAPPAEPSPVLVLLGPTATGKTNVAIAIARRIGGEVISADSRAVFAGLDVVAAKPTVAERSGVPHHLIDRVPFDREYDAMSFRRDVEQLLPEIASRERAPIIAGGGTVYLAALLRGIFPGPGKAPDLRARLRERPLDELHRQLATVDSAAARAIHPNDRLRIVRALEVHALTGRPISEWQQDASPLSARTIRFGLRRDRDDHREAIAVRTRRMIEAGLVAEVAELQRRGLRRGMQAFRTIGIPEAVGYLAGRLELDEMEHEIVRRTWALARRQAAFFRGFEGVRWLNPTGRTIDDVVEEIADRWNNERDKRPKNSES